MIELYRPLKRVSYLTLSDIHFFNDANETSYIADSMFHYFDGYSSKSRFIDLDIIFLAGDIFDKSIDSKNFNMIYVMNTLRSIMGFCARFNIKLRILEGTPSHDNKQSRWFDAMAAGYGESLDYRYIPALEIEIMKDLGISILYIPDEWLHSAAKAQVAAQEALLEAGLEKATIGIFHGMFDFQVPDLGEHILKHDSRWYHEHIEAFINIGHDHVFKANNRILVQGSFDRIAHGEEGKKGGIVCHLDPALGNSFEFVENTRARIFKTINVKTKSLDKGIEQVKEVLKNLPDNAHVRISTTPDNPIMSVVDEFKRSYPDMIFKKHKDKKQLLEEGNKLKETISLTSNYVAISLTPDNIVDMVVDNIDFSDVSTEDKELLISELKGLVT